MDKGKQIAGDIKIFLISNSIKFEFIEHEPTPTSEDAARVRGTRPEEGAKAIILKVSKTQDNVMVVLPGNLKIDSKKIRNVINSEISFEDPQKILEKFGIIVGGVPPFGNLLGSGIKMLIDQKLFENINISFNCGVRTASITMTSKDYKKLVENHSIIGNFSKDN